MSSEYWLVSIARTTLPSHIGDTTKENPGIGLHADDAKVNYNMWVQHDEACLSPESAGLIIWPRKPPGAPALHLSLCVGSM